MTNVSPAFPHPAGQRNLAYPLKGSEVPSSQGSGVRGGRRDHHSHPEPHPAGHAKCPYSPSSVPAARSPWLSVFSSSFSLWTSLWALDEREKPLRLSQWSTECTALGRAKQDMHPSQGADARCRCGAPAPTFPAPPGSDGGCLGMHFLSSQSSCLEW